MDEYGLYIVGVVNGYRLEIWRKNWIAEAITPKALALEGLSLRFFDGDILNRVSRTTVDVTFHDKDFASYYDDFFTADATRYKVVIYRLDNVESIYWSGYVTPDSYSYSTDIPVTITARDNIGYLDQIDFDLSGKQTISRIMEEAQKRMSWAANPWEWRGGYISGVIPFEQSIVDCDYIDGTWLSAVESLLGGYQLRFIGDNTWVIFEVTEMINFGFARPDSYSDVYGSATWSVVPSWRSATVSHDYGLKTNLFEWEQKEEDFIYNTSDLSPLGISRGSLYNNAELGNAIVLDNFNLLNAEISTSQHYNVIFLGLSRLGFRLGELETDYYTPTSSPLVITRDFGPGEKTSLSIEIDMIDLPFDRTRSGVEWFDPYLYISEASGMASYHSLDAVVSFNTGDQILYLHSDGWSSTPNAIGFTKILDSKVIDTSRGGSGYSETSTAYNIVIADMPNFSGNLRIELATNYSIANFNSGEMSIAGAWEHMLNGVVATGIKNISITPILTVDSAGIDIEGTINPNGNQKQSIELSYSETPTNVGGIGVLAKGLFNDQMESLTNWQRKDGKGGVINLSENIARAYSHLFNAFIREGEVSGGHICESTFGFSRYSNFAIEGKNYILSGYTHTLTNNRGKVTLREVSNYVYAEGVTFKANALSTGGSSLSSGNNDILEWSPIGGEITPSTKRIYELPTITDSEEDAGYIAVDYNGSQTAKKFAISTIKKWLSDKLDVAGGAITGSLSVAKDFIVEGLTKLFNVEVSGTATVEHLKSKDYADLISGFRMWIDSNGRSTLFANRIISDELLVDVITANLMQAVGGTMVISAAWAKSTRVDVADGVVRVYYKPALGLQQWQVGDQPRMENAGRLFWGLVTSVSTEAVNEEHWFECAGLEEDVDFVGSKVFADGDEFVLYGSRGEKANRKNLIVISASMDSPTIVAYNNVNSFNITQANQGYKLDKNFEFGDSARGGQHITYNDDGTVDVSIWAKTFVVQAPTGDLDLFDAITNAQASADEAKETIQKQVIGGQNYLRLKFEKTIEKIATVARNEKLVARNGKLYGWRTPDSGGDNIVRQTIHLADYPELVAGLEQFAIPARNSRMVARNGKLIAFQTNHAQEPQLVLDYWDNIKDVEDVYLEWLKDGEIVGSSERGLAPSVVTVPRSATDLRVTIRTKEGTVCPTDVKATLQIGNKPTEWKEGFIDRDTKIAATDYLQEATSRGQTFAGGLLLSNLIAVLQFINKPVSELTDEEKLRLMSVVISGNQTDGIAISAHPNGAYSKAVDFIQSGFNPPNTLITSEGQIYTSSIECGNPTFGYSRNITTPFCNVLISEGADNVNITTALPMPALTASEWREPIPSIVEGESIVVEGASTMSSVQLVSPSIELKYPSRLTFALYVGGDIRKYTVQRKNEYNGEWVDWHSVYLTQNPSELATTHSEYVMEGEYRVVASASSYTAESALPKIALVQIANNVLMENFAITGVFTYGNGWISIFDNPTYGRSVYGIRGGEILDYKG